MKTLALSLAIAFPVPAMAQVFGPQHVVTTTADYASSVYATDLDGDGDADVLWASWLDDKIAWYENLGAGSFGPQQVITTLASGAFGVFATDLDGDGDVDVLSASWGKIAWYENLGLGSFGPQQVITTAADQARAVYATDLDGDGDADVLSASAGDDKIAWYENLGGGTFGPQQVITTAADGATSVYATDLDGDGDADVLSASSPTPWPWLVGKIAWYENLGAGIFGPQLVITTAIAADLAGSVYAADLDGDGDADVLSALSNGIALHENLGSGAFGPQQVITTPGARSVFATDFEGDGDSDVLFSSYLEYDDHDESVIAWLETCPCDCNANGQPDQVDIGSMASSDCNLNGVPDECDLARATSHDCNANGVPDECELANLPQTAWTVYPGGSIQDAISQACQGDTIQVSAGTYFENLDFLGKSLHLVGAGLEAAVIDGGGVGRVLTIEGTTGPVTIENVTIRNGLAPETEYTGGYEYPWLGHGGGAYCVDVDVSFINCTIEGNRADNFGGGVYLKGGTAHFQSCSFISNNRPTVNDPYYYPALNSGGGGLYADDCALTIEGCSFEGNVGGNGAGISAGGGTFEMYDTVLRSNSINVENGYYGGGLSLWVSDAMIARCRFEYNTSWQQSGRGGGLSGGSGTVTDSVFIGNYAGYGGAASVHNFVFESCLFDSNHSNDDWSWDPAQVRGGGAVHSESPGVIIRRSVFRRNSSCFFYCSTDGAPPAAKGGAVYGPILLENCLLLDNMAEVGGGGAWGATLHNCIVTGNYPNQLDGGSTASFTFVDGGWPGTGNLAGNPLVIDNGRLLSGSPCIDAGDPASPVDLDGSFADMGAFPFVDCNVNGVLDDEDIAQDVNLDLNMNGVLDECECYVETYCWTRTNSTGNSASIANGGSLSVSLNDLVLVASNLPTNEFGIFYYGQGQTQSLFGEGYRCVFGTLTRLHPPSNTGAFGVATYAIDNTNPAHDPLGQITPATTLHFQFWYRDPTGGPAGFNLSDGLSLTFCP